MGVFSDFKPKNNAARNGFDLSRYSSFTAKCGSILPVFNQLTLQGGDYHIDVKQLLRTQPLNTAAFAGFTVNYDVVFTPLNHLYSSFNQFISQRENKNSSLQPANTLVPTFDLRGFILFTLRYAVWDYMASFYSENEWKHLSQDSEKIPYFIYRSEHDRSQSVCLDVIRNLDLFGYGNLLPMVKYTYECLKVYWSYSFSASIPEGHSVDDLIGLQYCISQEFDLQSNDFSFEKWFDCLSDAHVYVNSNIDFQELLLQYSDLKPTLWPVLAYNKSFHEFYRNVYYDTIYRFEYWDDVSEFDYVTDEIPYVNLFNFDDWSSSYNTINVDDSKYMRLLCMFAVKPHLYKRDLFTGILPSTQFGDVSVMIDQDIFRKLLYHPDPSSGSLDPGQVFVSGGSNNNDVRAFPTSNPVVYLGKSFKFDPAIAISVLESRRADAMQRFKERMLRAGDKVKDIFRAHGWSEPKSEKSWEPIFLGSFDGRLDINTVAATAESGDFNVGQLAANGVATVNGSTINFKNTDFGLIQIFFYITKDAVYNSYGLNGQHMLTEPFDWPYPELQNISLAPINKGQLSAAIDVDDYQADNFNDVIGYLPRFMQFKTAVDEVHGEFFSAYPLADADKRFGGANYKVSLNDGIFAHWVTARQDVNDYKDLSFLYISPSCADNIFAVNAGARQECDQFIVNSYFKCTAVEPLTVIGLPI